MLAANEIGIWRIFAPWEFDIANQRRDVEAFVHFLLVACDYDIDALFRLSCFVKGDSCREVSVVETVLCSLFVDLADHLDGFGFLTQNKRLVQFLLDVEDQFFHFCVEVSELLVDLLKEKLEWIFDLRASHAHTRGQLLKSVVHIQNESL